MQLLFGRMAGRQRHRVSVPDADDETTPVWLITSLNRCDIGSMFSLVISYFFQALMVLTNVLGQKSA